MQRLYDKKNIPFGINFLPLEKFYIMKKNSFILVLLSIPVVALLFMGYSSGQTQPYSGSPGDGNLTCAVCHNGGSFGASVGITTDIPDTGFVPGETYNITVTAYSTSTKHGFQITSENTDDFKSGTFTAGSDNQTADNNHLVTHTYSGTALTEWHMTWTAPEGNDAADSSITFYAVVNATNNDNNTTGDEVVTNNITVERDTQAGVAEQDVQSLKISPNPVRDIIHFNTELTDNATYRILDTQGKVILQGKINGQDLSLSSSISQGVYYLHITDGSRRYSTAFVKK